MPAPKKYPGELLEPAIRFASDHRRLHSACDDIPPVEFEHHHYRSIAAPSPEVPARASLH